MRVCGGRVSFSGRKAAILVLTGSPFSEVTRTFLDLANSLAEEVSEARVYLFYDGVLAAKKGNQMETTLRDLAQKGVQVIVK